MLSRALFQPWWPFAQAANRVQARSFARAAKFVPVPGLDWAQKKRAPSRLVAGKERLGSCLEFRLSAAEPCSAAIRPPIESRTSRRGVRLLESSGICRVRSTLPPFVNRTSTLARKVTRRLLPLDPIQNWPSVSFSIFIGSYMNLIRRSATMTMRRSIHPWLQRWIFVSP